MNMEGILKYCIDFILKYRGFWNAYKGFVLSGKQNGATLTNFLTSNAHRFGDDLGRAAQAINQRPEWQTAARSTHENMGELNNAVYHTAQHLPGLQGKSPDEINGLVRGIATNTGFFQEGEI